MSAEDAAAQKKFDGNSLPRPGQGKMGSGGG
jgi:hypothetical protein